MGFDALSFLCIMIALRHLERAWPTHLQISQQTLSMAVSRDTFRIDRPGLAAKISRGGEVT